ncbi:hypothetical protein AB1N83_007616 [Pleurotus pulmonarius]
MYDTWRPDRVLSQAPCTGGPTRVPLVKDTRLSTASCPVASDSLTHCSLIIPRGMSALPQEYLHRLDSIETPKLNDRFPLELHIILDCLCIWLELFSFIPYRCRPRISIIAWSPLDRHKEYAFGCLSNGNLNPGVLALFVCMTETLT